MPRLDSSKGRCRYWSELSVRAARARRIRATPRETKARARVKAKTRTSTRAMTGTRPRDGTTGTVVSNKRNSRATAHISRSGATNAQIVGLDSLNRKVVQWLAFKNLNLKLTVSRQHNGVMPTVMVLTWIRRAGVLQRRTIQGPAACRRSHLPSRFCQRISVEKECED